MLDHDVAHIGPQGERPTSYVIRNNFREKYGKISSCPVVTTKNWRTPGLWRTFSILLTAKQRARCLWLWLVDMTFCTRRR